VRVINPFREINWHPGLAERRAFGRSLVAGFPIVAAALVFLIRWNTGAWPAWPLWLGGIGAGIGALCRAAPRLALPFYFFWFGVAGCAGLIVSNGILAAVFYLVVTPIGLVLRVFGNDPLGRKFDRTAASYWMPAEKGVAPGRYFRQF
jgi:Saxitoxin biosynthesis operon protein SxtJ